MYSDTMFLKVNAFRSCAAAQVWSDGQGSSLFYPIKSKALAHTTIYHMIHDLNATPTVVITDGARKKEMNHFHIKQKWSEYYTLIAHNKTPSTGCTWFSPLYD